LLRTKINECDENAETAMKERLAIDDWDAKLESCVCLTRP
jgi:hypothetical protein